MRDFWNSFQFKIPTVFILSFLLILATIFGVFSTIGKSLLEKQTYKEVILSGENIVSELGNRIARTESLATALANLGEKLPQEVGLTKDLVRHVLHVEGTETFIAGGGLWPEPHLYDPSVERRSFFWGRDAQGVLQYYDDYNDPGGPGYHHEEWYVPARHLKDGETFWSKSYMDPYSYQPMVTVTAPMYRDNRFYGVSTVDLKLEGLHAFLDAISRSFNGYTFAVDRNGKFLSFPDEALTKTHGIDAQGKQTEEFIKIDDLATRRPAFLPLAKLVKDATDNVLATASGLRNFDKGLARTLAQDSYQIDEQEAGLIAAVLATMQNDSPELGIEPQQLFVDQDMLLGEAAFVAIFEMPRTHWKIVTVMPYSNAVGASNQIYWNLVSATLVAMLFSLVIMLLVVKRTLVRPITDMSEQLQLLAKAPKSENKKLEIADKGELGKLAFRFNQRSQRLFDVQGELQKAHEDLERRVAERTDALRKEVERRKQEQQLKEQQVSRVEKQHVAIVDLSLRGPLFQGDLAKAARTINEIAVEVIGVARSSVWLLDDTGEVFYAVDLFERATAAHTNEYKLTVNDYPAYFEALRYDRSIAVSNVLSDKRTHELRDYAKTCGISSLLDSPIRVGGKMRGIVCFEHVGPDREWTDDERRFSGEIADRFLQVLNDAERLKSEERIRRMAFYDSLMELANRRLLQETIQHELEVARRHKMYGSLLYLDLDNFKTLNDSLGHHIGDELLVQLSRRLRATLRKEDVAARLGGDEFVVLIIGENTSKHGAVEQAVTVAKKIRATIGEPYRLHGYEHIISSSIGITLYPENDDTAADVLKQADTAMYRAKEDGRNTVCFYNPEMQEEADSRLLMEKELRTAIAGGQFALYFQPQVDCHGELVGAEALIRWMHPAKGLVLPKEFIPIAEETGLILELGAWILKEACECSKDCSIGHVAVNISPLQFRQPDFVDIVTAILAETQADPENLMIELTEGIVIENIDSTVSKMNALKAMGIRISIDDFGTGYSSLAYLKQLPLDQLKINDEFVRDISTDSSDAVIVDTIISMARHLGLDVVAEGVETREQLDFLNEKGCHILQGHYFSLPLPKAEFVSYMQKADTAHPAATRQLK